MGVLEARDIVKEYRTEGETIRALKGVSLDIEAGEFIAVMGPSGSGKSTLLNLLGLLDEPTSGGIYLDGEDTSDLDGRSRTSARKRTIGFVFQDFYLIPTLTARENVEIPRLLDRDPASPERAATLLEGVGLGERLEHKPGELSGGQKQRVAIARSRINEPRVVLADEPTGNLDRSTSRLVLAQFTEICDEGVAVVAVTHDQLVTEFTDRTVSLIDGRINPDPSSAGTATEDESVEPSSTSAVSDDAGSNHSTHNGG